MDRHHATERIAASRPTLAPSTRITDLMAALVAELEAGDIPDPLGQPLTLGIVWADLCRLAGEEPPPAVAAMHDEPVAA